MARRITDGDTGTMVDTGVDDEPVIKRKRAGTLELGGRFARYVVLQHVGSGGAGSVYAAYDPELDRKVALKVLKDDRPRARQRLMREAQAIARVNHPNIVSVHDVGTHAGQVYIAMEFVDGVTLRRWLVAEQRDYKQIIAKCVEAGEGLAAAHDAGLVHRDFKPDNVLVEHGGRVVVLDFGLARRTTTSMDSQRSVEDAELEAELRGSRQTPLDINITGAGALMGTPAYMAPEQHLRQAVDARTDQFAFCVVLWEALYGERPFKGESPTTTAVAVTRGDINEPRRPSAAPVWVRRLLEQGLRPNADDRHADMRTLLELLRNDPWTMRRRVAGVAAVVATAAAAGYILTPAAPDTELCAADQERWAGVWDDARRTRIGEAFRATGAPYAEQAFASVTSTLDGYVDRWNTLHREACEATHLHGLQTRDTLELQWSCLGRRRGEVAALTDELIVADATVVEHAVEAVRDLRSINGCSDLEALGRSPALPADEGTRQRVEALRDQLVDARAKMHAARFVQAIEIVEQVAEAATKSRQAPLQAEAKLLLGALHEATGRFDAARDALLEAVWAGQSSGHDEVVARAWTRLVWVVGVEMVHTEDGELWGKFAEAAVTKIGDPPLLRAQLVHNIGGVLYRQGRLDAALDHYGRALKTQQDELGSEHPQIATTLNHMANTLIELGRFSEAREYAERSLGLRQRVLGARHPKVAAALNNIGELERKQGNPLASLKAAKRSLEIVAGRGGPEELVALVLAGEAQRHLRRWEEAASTYERIVELREAIDGPDHQSLVAPLRSLAAARMALGELGKAEIATKRADALERR